MKTSSTVALACALAVGGVPAGAAEGKGGGAKSPDCMRVRDSQNRVVGTIVGVITPGLGSSIVVFTQIDNAVYPLQVVDQRLLGMMDNGLAGATYVAFTTPDCTGTPYLDTGAVPESPPPLYARTAVAGPGELLYVQVPGSPLETIEYRSLMSAGALDCTPCGGPCGYGPIQAVRSTVIANLGQMFTPPFQIAACP